MIALEGCSLSRGGRLLLDRVSLALRPGEVLALVGPNGAGKSTLLRLFSGELAPDEGMARLDGQDLAGWDPLELSRRRAVVSQKIALSFPLRAAEVAALGRLPWHGTAAMRQDRAATAQAMARAGIAHLAERPYGRLSGGEQQRVQIARALAQLSGMAQPAALLLDEPTASLDAGHRAQLLQLLRALAAEGLAVLIVLHDLNEARFVADRVALLQQGRLVAEGSPASVFDPARLQAVYGIPFLATEEALLPRYAAASRQEG